MYDVKGKRVWVADHRSIVANDRCPVDFLMNNQLLEYCDFLRHAGDCVARERPTT